VVSSWTNIPLRDLTEEESKKLLRMEEALHKRVIGQDEAVKAVSQAIRRARAGVKNIKRPVGVFIFLGPTGVGKTELARALAEFLLFFPDLFQLLFQFFQILGESISFKSYHCCCFIYYIYGFIGKKSPLNVTVRQPCCCH